MDPPAGADSDATSPARVLIVEDNPDDAALEVRALGSIGVPVGATLVVATEADLRERLGQFEPDVVLTDYALPGFSGAAVLEIVRRLSPSVPVVVVSGAIGDEQAVELLKAGAADYVLKDRMSRLGPAVRRALEDAAAAAETSELQAELRRSEDLYRAIVETADEGIWLIDEAGTTTFANASMARLAGTTADAMVGRPLDGFFAHERPGAIRWGIAEESGARLPREYGLLRPDGSVVWTLVNASPIDAGHGKGTLLMLTDVTERHHASAAREGALAGTVRALGSLSELRDPYTAGHQHRVAALARAIATALGLDEDEVNGIELGASIHDIGKIAVPAEILARPGAISPLERALIETHPRAGVEVIAEIPFPWPVSEIILQHHERLDGSGYPDHLVGDDIHPSARIVAVADVVEAMSSHRPYRAARGVSEALEEITRFRNIRYAPEPVDACIGLFLDDKFAFT